MEAKNKLHTRLFSVICATIMIVALLSACNPEAASTGPTGTTTKATTTAGTTTAPTETALPIRAISILCCDFRFNFDAHPLSARQDYPAYQKFEADLAQLGLELTYETIAPDQLELTLQTRLASGGELPDILAALDKINDADAVRYGKEGIVLDIVSAIEQYDEANSIFTFWDTYYPGARGMLTAENGAIYWFPYLYTITVIDDPDFQYVGTGLGASLRKDWIDELGLTYKTVLTPDELYAILDAYRSGDANQNDIEDETLGIGLGWFNNGIAQGYGLPGDLVRVVTGQDQVQCPWYGTYIKDYITFMKKLVDDGIYDTAVLGSGVADQMLAENKIGLVHNYFSQTWLEPQVAGVTAEYAPFVLDTGLSGVKPVLYLQSNLGVWGKWCLSSSCQDVGAVIDLFKYIYTPEYATLSKYGIEDVTYTVQPSGLKKLNYDFGTTMADSNNKNVALDFLIGQNALPDLSLGEYTKDALLNETTYDSKNAMQAFVQTYDCGYDSMVQTLALATDAENEIVNKHGTVLGTYSTELLTDLILGNKPLDNLDTYIAEMKELGLDEFIAVYQARYDRFLAAGGQ